ncbi:MAG: transcription antitermination factor NusB [Rhodocyclaceae bacterium]|nr:transcription antitermination factor NusB [Rhodocyclaceae bacterium]
MSNKSSRRRAREFALQGIYQWLLNNSGVALIEEHLAQVPGFDKADREIFVSRLRGTITNREALDAEIAPLIDREVAELSPVEHAVLLLAAQELTHHIEVPYRVIINEAIELTKEFGGTDGHRFVNGVLDRLAAKLRATEVEAAAKGRRA